jgi:thioredoxin-related protein
MKKLFIFLLLSGVLLADHISWLGDYNKALRIAQKQKRPMMVLLVRNDCTACNEMIKNLFINRPYIQKLNTQFVSVIVNASNKHSYPIELFYSTVFPTLFFVNPQEQFIYKPIYKSITQDKFENLLNL